MKAKPPRKKKCAFCRETFQPHPLRPFQPCCSPACAIAKAKADRAKKEKKELAERRKGIRTRTEWLTKAQTAFNAYIRARDAEKPCIVCGTHHRAVYQAGHFYSRGARPDLRFNENNCFKQCSQTNKYTSVDTAEKFRNNVFARIGQVEFKRLSVVGRSDWTIEEIQAIEKEYKIKRKTLCT